jgi:NADPH2:quinone reductase
MKAAWYKTQGSAREVLQVGELPAPLPEQGEVRVKIHFSGVNPGDTKKRADWMGFGMSHPLVVPHSDGSGVIDAIGKGVDEKRIGERVWVYGAQSGRQYGTAAEYSVVPADQAVPLPNEVSYEVGASLGIPGITAHELVMSDGSVKDKIVFIQGILGAVGSLAAQIAHRDGAKVFGSVRLASELEAVNRSIVDEVFSLDDEALIEKIKAAAPKGVHRIIEVSLSDNADLDADIIATHGIIATYATREDRTEIPFWPMLFSNVTIKLYGGDGFSHQAKQRAAFQLTQAAKEGALSIAIAESLPLESIAEAHDKVDAGARQRIILKIS